ncbi:MAG TPA: nuclear transport factor 2 family protein [Usitatibacter sp.]|nr:nuclear transport factor 2 family protein [Usitatibacter sp.]
MKESVTELIYDGCMAMNAQDWQAFLALCEPEGFRYRITNYSPEILRTQCWMDRDFKGLKSIIELLPRHNTDHSPLTRHATVYKVRQDAQTGEVRAHTQLAIYRTELDGSNSHFDSGKTALWAIGRYEDRIRVGDGGARLLERNVVLDTRQIDIGSHLPL